MSYLYNTPFMPLFWLCFGECEDVCDGHRVSFPQPDTQVLKGNQTSTISHSWILPPLGFDPWFPQTRSHNADEENLEKSVNYKNFWDPHGLKASWGNCKK